MFSDFFIDYKTVRQRISGIDPAAYASTRNHLEGSVTRLSPFITHGVISTSTVATTVLDRHSSSSAEKILYELAWREYFHRIWQVSDNAIFRDFKQAQAPVCSERLPSAVVNASVGIEVVDRAVNDLEAGGYMHNHARMWVAALTCNIARTHWYQPARWLYYHLLDGDLASNCLSWQWVAGTFSQKKYIANQENLNRFSGVEQVGTFLDTDYEGLAELPTPEVLQARCDVTFSNSFPESTASPLSSIEDPVFLYSIWNLDRDWQQEGQGRRVLWIEPDMHREFALSPLRWRFIEHWANAIEGLEIFVGDQDALFPAGTDQMRIYTREYPATTHWPGQRDERDWCYECPTGTIKSFSNYWKKARKASSFFAQ